MGGFRHDLARTLKELKGVKDPIPHVIPFFGRKYKLVSVAYSSSGHFTSVGKNRYKGDNALYFHDGMLNNGQYVRWDTQDFPFVIGQSQATDMYYVREDALLESDW